MDPTTNMDFLLEQNPQPHENYMMTHKWSSKTL